ncbi:hypothetical protein KV201_14140 [Shewanella sp. SR1]|uniref:hypothetical protein n=1 Tax=Shewanella sp. SR1 TaxID=2855505 RepID=UPI001CF15E1A|nr:hypothetical protein [Shewanella sp. SR1]MCB2383314.1 hypothetical protein [Shewanella sp. SR1]
MGLHIMLEKDSRLSHQSKRSNQSAVSKWLFTTGMVAHSIAICLLCYLSSGQLVNTTGALLYHMGMPWTDAVVVTSMLGFIYLVLILLWAFSRNGVLRTWLNVSSLMGFSIFMAWIIGALA